MCIFSLAHNFYHFENTTRKERKNEKDISDLCYEFHYTINMLWYYVKIRVCRGGGRRVE